jgi:hypothetical protein
MSSANIRVFNGRGWKNISGMVQKRNMYRVLVAKFAGKRPLRRPRRRWRENVEMDLKDIGWKMWTGFIWLMVTTFGINFNKALGLRRGNVQVQFYISDNTSYFLDQQVTYCCFNPLSSYTGNVFSFTNVCL